MNPQRYPNHVEVPVPVRERHLTGAHWWDPDRINHLDDLPRFCPSCGTGLDEGRGFSVEYWDEHDRVYHTWCQGCSWAGNITRVDRMVGPDAPH